MMMMIFPSLLKVVDDSEDELYLVKIAKSFDRRSNSLHCQNVQMQMHQKESP